MNDIVRHFIILKLSATLIIKHNNNNAYCLDLFNTFQLTIERMRYFKQNIYYQN